MKRVDETICDAARQTFKEKEGAPLFYCDWVSAAFVHFEVDPAVLQQEVPYKLDLRDGKAYVSLVAFTMQRLRPRVGGRLSAAAFAPIAEHSFMNVRTYVAQDGERGIYFLLEWVSKRLAVLLGPKTFGLPYRHGDLHYRHERNANLDDCVTCGSERLAFHAKAVDERKPGACTHGSLDEWLLERYVAFTRRGETPMYFRVWHEHWPQVPVRVQFEDDALLRAACNWYAKTSPKVVCGNFSAGVKDVWIGWPRGIDALSRRNAFDNFSFKRPMAIGS
jgi:uncharacterized protein